MAEPVFLNAAKGYRHREDGAKRISLLGAESRIHGDQGDVRENTSCLSVQVEQGKVYHIEQSPRMGFLIARNKLERVSAEESQKILDKCKPPKLAE